MTFQYAVRAVGTDSIYGSHWTDVDEAREELANCRAFWAPIEFELVARTVSVSEWNASVVEGQS